MEPTSDQLWDLFRALSFIRQQSRALSRDEPGLDGVSVALLSLAAQRESLRPSEVAEELQLTRPAVTRHLRALEDAGAIRLEADPGDGRSWLVRVLPEGFAQLQRFRERIVGIYGELLADWKPADLDRLTVLLTRLGESMARRPRSAPVRPSRRRGRG